LKFYVGISTEFETKRDKFQVKQMDIHKKKQIKQFHTQTNIPFSLRVIDKSCGTNLRLKSQPKLNTHNNECLVRISDQNTQGYKA